MLIVQKYGGTSLVGPERIFAAARRAAEDARKGAQVVVVVSAQGHTTDELIEAAGQIDPRADEREMDAYMAAGEQLSAGLMAMALRRLAATPSMGRAEMLPLRTSSSAMGPRKPAYRNMLTVLVSMVAISKATMADRPI